MWRYCIFSGGVFYSEPPCITNCSRTPRQPVLLSRRSQFILSVDQTWNWVIGSPDQWVIWVIFHVRVTGSSFWPDVRPEFFRFSKKMTKRQNAHLKCWNDKSYCQVPDYLPCRVLEYLIRYSREYSSSKKRDSHTPTHKSTFGVHYRRGSPGQLGLRVAGFPGHWVAGSQNVTQFHVCVDCLVLSCLVLSCLEPCSVRRSVALSTACLQIGSRLPQITQNNAKIGGNIWIVYRLIVAAYYIELIRMTVRI